MNHNYQKSFAFTDDLIIDNFCGGGGASLGIEWALGRPVDIAINHDQKAIEMHTLNHPQTHHYCESVWDVDPREAIGDNRVKLVWLSPDCKHFSKAKGGTPVDNKIRGLAWVGLRWAAVAKPDVMFLENVEEFTTWGPIVDGRPCKKRKGETFKSFTKALNRQGYQVEYKTLRACDYGAPTIRKRLFMVARRDGLPICWPVPTHGPKDSGLLPFKTTADIIDWSIPCHSIFERKRPLVHNTLRRIAKGIEKFVFKNPKPFIVRIGQTGFGGDGLQYSIDQPLTTITSKNEHCLVIPIIDRQFSGSNCASVEEPLGTVMPDGGGKSALVQMLLAKHDVANQSLHTNEVQAFLIKYYSSNIGLKLDEPLHTVPTRDRFGLITVYGEDYQIVDIKFRMLSARELYRAQSFPDSYDFSQVTKTQAVAKCGNSVCPIVAKVLVESNLVQKKQTRRKSA